MIVITRDNTISGGYTVKDNLENIDVILIELSKISTKLCRFKFKNVFKQKYDFLLSVIGAPSCIKTISGILTVYEKDVQVAKSIYKDYFQT